MSDLTLDGIVYADMGVTNGVHSWTDHSAGVPAGFCTLTQRINLTKERANFLSKLYLPKVAVSDPSACACPGDLLAECYFDINVRTSKNTDGLMRAFILQAIRDYVDTSEFAGLLTNFKP
jgi:hypothetical protein